MINLCYLVKCDIDTYLTRDEFTILANSILTTNMQEDALDFGNFRHTHPIHLMYDYICSNKNRIEDSNKYRLEENNSSNIEDLYDLFSSLSSRVDVSKELLVCVHALVSNITQTSRKNYLVKVREEEDNIKCIFGINNAVHLNVFEIVYWMNSKHSKDNNEIDNKVVELLTSWQDDVAYQDDMNGYLDILRFLKAYCTSDIHSILRYLAKFGMIEEYAFTLSYYSYAAVINGTIDSKVLDSDVCKKVATCLCFPLAQQIYSSIVLNNSLDKLQSDPQTSRLSEGFSSLIKKIFETSKGSFLDRFLADRYTHTKKSSMDRQELHKHMNCIEMLITGQTFMPYDSYMDTVLKELRLVGTGTDFDHLITRVKNFYEFKPDYYEDYMQAENAQEMKKVASHSSIQSAFTMRRCWELAKHKFATEAKRKKGVEPKVLIYEIQSFVKQESDFAFMQVGEKDTQQLVHLIYPAIIFVFLYLKNVRLEVDRNDVGARLVVIRQTLFLIWKCFLDLKHLGSQQRDPLELLGIYSKKQKVDFLNKYSSLLHSLNVKKSNHILLKELLKFSKQFIFSLSLARVSDHTLEKLLNSLKLDSFMELYDYLEELDNGKEMSENYKENIVNLFIQVIGQQEKFIRHIPDIKQVVKLIQGDMSKIDYFIDKLFVKTETSSYVKNNINRYLVAFNKLNRANTLSKDLLQATNSSSIHVMDREALYRRASEGYCTPGEILLILSGRPIRNRQISLQEIELVFRRLSINLTEHRLSELLSSSKLMHANRVSSQKKMQFSHFDETEFEHIFEYMETLTILVAKENMEICASRIIKLVLWIIVEFLFILLLVSNIMVDYFAGELFGSIMCASIPLIYALYTSRVRIVQKLQHEETRLNLETAFDIVTTSKHELIN